MPLRRSIGRSISVAAPVCISGSWGTVLMPMTAFMYCWRRFSTMLSTSTWWASANRLSWRFRARSFRWGIMVGVYLSTKWKMSLPRWIRAESTIRRHLKSLSVWMVSVSRRSMLCRRAFSYSLIATEWVTRWVMLAEKCSRRAVWCLPTRRTVHWFSFLPMERFLKIMLTGRNW